MRLIEEKNGNALAFVRVLQTRMNRTGSLRQATESVRKIVQDVRRHGDKALVQYGNRFDGTRFKPPDLPVRQHEFDQAARAVSRDFKRAIRKAMQRVKTFQSAIRPNNRIVMREGGLTLKVRFVPIEKIGLYVPGGTANYPSSVIMTAVPAVVAGVKDIIMTTPPGENGQVAPEVLYAAQISGITKVFKTGGAGAIAAMAYGTRRVPKVDKILGPGNMYVNLAKRMVMETVGIDGFPGPSEILILADTSADYRNVAGDLISQLEHDPGMAILVTTSRRYAAKVALEAGRQAEEASKSKAILNGLKNFSVAVVTKNMTQAIDVANAIAPEHMEICTRDAARVAKKIMHAGAIFVGAHSPVPMGDYIAGPSHVLPTGGTARYSAVLSCLDFLLLRNEVTGSARAIRELGPFVKTLADVEQLPAHHTAFTLRQQA